MTSKTRRTMAAINAMADESQRVIDEAAQRARTAAYNEFWCCAIPELLAASSDSTVISTAPIRRVQGFLDFLICGLPAHKRTGRLMAMFGVYGDDSGSHEDSPLTTLSGLVATQEAWKLFSDDWHRELIADPAISYYKSYEAESLKGCFLGFSRKQADAKTDALTDIILSHLIYGILSAIRWSDFKDIIQAYAPRPKGRLHNYIKDPYYMMFHDVTSSVVTEQVERDLKGEVDFVFDRQGKLLTRCIAQYEEFREKLPESRQVIMGQVIPGDDKLILPLQAADLIAWQARNRSWPHKGRHTTSYDKIAESKKVFFHVFTPSELRIFVQSLTLGFMNSTFSEDKGI